MRLIPALLLLVALLAGCGGNDNFSEQVTEAQTTLQRATAGWGEEVGNDLLKGDNAAAATKLDQTGKAMDHAADQFGAIDMPQELEHARGRIVDGLHKLGGSLHSPGGAAP